MTQQKLWYWYTVTGAYSGARGEKTRRTRKTIVHHIGTPPKKYTKTTYNPSLCIIHRC